MDHYLRKLISSKRDKKISYSEYMETALYTPDIGYYMKPGTKIGRTGDFYTSSNVNNVFGSCLGKWAAKVIRQAKLIPRILEIGGGTGKFAFDLLSSLKRTDPELFKQLTYTIVDSSPFHQSEQKEKLAEFPNVVFLKELPQEFLGIIVSNELFDALPVHVIEKKQGVLYEVFIKEHDGSFCETIERLSDSRIQEYILSQSIELAENQRYEIPIKMLDMISTISNTLAKGVVVTFDYGYTQTEWMESIHRKGSLRGYYRHQQIEDILQHPGQMDLTAHIHFDALQHYGERAGLRFERLQSQADFLIGAGLFSELEDHQNLNPFSDTAKRNRAIRSLVMPGGISSYFRVMLQSKGIQGKLSE